MGSHAAYMGRKELKNVWFLYPKKIKAESLSATQHKLGNTPFPILINWYGMISCAAYEEQVCLLWSKFFEKVIFEALPNIKVCLQKLKSTMLIKNNKQLVHNYTTTYYVSK